ncbi:hypothetical protein [uncultured Microbacterium sp.]|uniref:Uncharacterized protein n=1 Tax=uncultured Microbacterium sp. TaxID=191216 RepID=A0A1Y5P0D9_9MICO|nr:hypothetical protein [uncultured Microbacterium sp.]SBS72137.1 hypothetical protein MIPYR_20438 [uncultured Microbacterium sp.]
MRIQIRLSTGIAFTGELLANPVAIAVASRLPLTATFSDFLDTLRALPDGFTARIARADEEV